MMSKYANQKLDIKLQTPAQVFASGQKRVCEFKSVDEDFMVIRFPDDEQESTCSSYNRKGIFKISIHQGANQIYYADKKVEIKKQGILFSRPNMVYRFEHSGKQYPGYLCVFTEKFFDQFLGINGYPLFKPGISPLIEITEAQLEYFSKLFKKMEHEIQLDFAYKLDAIRVLIIQVVLEALRVLPKPELKFNESNSSTRLNSHFIELLEGQFPIMSRAQKMNLRHPAEFADALFVHVNHLNRVLKEVSGKTTSQLIAARIFLEAKSALQNTDWNISEIAWCLGFEDLSHFIRFFKKNAGRTPSKLRKILAI